MKQTLWNYLAQGSNAPIPPWLDALTLRVTGDTVRVGFPHPFFGAWFHTHKQNLFEQALHACYADTYTHIAYDIANAPETHALTPQHARQPRKNPETRTTPEVGFNNFLYNDKNAVPIAILSTIARQSPGSAYGLVLLCGPSGSGKTHLLRALASHFREHQICVAEHVLDFARHSLADQPERFWQEYTALFLDDIQDLVAYPDTQYRLIHCIDACPNDRQIVLTALGAHNELSNLDQRLRTRLASGLVLELAEPDLDVRLRFIQQLCSKKNIRITRKQMLLLAQRCPQYRHIQGILQKIVAFANAHNRAISQTDIELVLRAGKIERLVDYTTIIKAVAQKMNVTLEEILGKERKTRLVRARQLAMYMCRNKLGLSYPELGRVFGDKDHSTVIYAIKKIENLVANDSTMHTLIADLERNFQ